MKVATYPTAAGTDLTAALAHVADKSREYRTAPLSDLRIDRESGYATGAGLDLPLTSFSARKLAGMVHVPTGWALRAPTDIVADTMNYFLEHASGNVQLAIDDAKYITGFLPEGYVQPHSRAVIERVGNEASYTPVSWTHDDHGLSIRSVTDLNPVQPTLGDVIKLGVDLSLRDDKDSLNVRGVAYRLVCLNGATAPEHADIRRALRREGWRDPIVRVDLAVGSFNEAALAMAQRWELLGSAANVALELPVDDDTERLHLLRAPMRVLGLPSRYVDSISDALRSEDPSLYGLYNAVTRLGRDAASREVRGVFERAGYRVAERLEKLTESLEVLA